MRLAIGSRPRSAGRGIAFSLVTLALLGVPGIAHSATPPSGTLSPGNPSLAWDGALIAGTNQTEADCVEGVTCDTFVLTLAAGDYTGKRVTVGLTWTSPGNDMDLYVHEGAPDGPIITQSTDFIPDTEERAYISLNPYVVPADRTYYVHAVSFAVTVPGYTGDAAIVDDAPPRNPVYLAGAINFSENVSLKAPAAASDGEPSVRVDVRGNCYVGAIRGVPAGVDLWRFDLDPASPGFDPGMQDPVYLGQPDAFLPQDPQDPTAGGADGGGDIDIAVSFPTHPDSIPVVTVVSLAAANISSATSFDRGETFTLAPATVFVPADDRQWIEAMGENTVYMMYRAPIPATGLFVQRSDDHGLTYPFTGVVSPTGTAPGYIDVDHATGRVYVAHAGSTSLAVGVSTDGGLTWRNNTVDNSTVHGVLFDVVKVGDDGTAYALWSDGRDIYLAHSTDGGAAWSNKVRVNDNSVYRTNMFPWLEAGTAGRVAVVWYGSTSAANGDDSDWVVLFSQCMDATAPDPVFHQQVVSDHVIHGSNISTGGLTGGDNRNLIDYFQVALDPQGAAVIAYTDDSNDFDGHTRVTRQLDGPGLYAHANGGAGTVDPATPPPLPAPDPEEPEVSDFLHDAVIGLLQPIPEDNAYDALSVDYSCDLSETDGLKLVAAMTVSSLDVVPAGANWRMSFTANAPGGLSDRGDQFFMRANTDNPASPVFMWGTTVRTSGGGLTYTDRGACEGFIDSANDRIVLRVPVDDLNAFVTHGPELAAGSVLHGLRGSAFTTTDPSAPSGIRDVTRGGTSYTLGCGTILDTPDGDILPSGAFLLGPARPNPMAASSQIAFRIDRTGFVDLGIFDVSGRRIRTLEAGILSPGDYVRTWDGRTDRFSDAPSGVYFYVLATAGGRSSEKLVLSR